VTIFALSYSFVLSHQHVCDSRQWQPATGLTQPEFELLIYYFGQTYEFFHGLSINQLANNIDIDLKLATYADCRAIASTMQLRK
jgi:hypothetical protein